MEPAGGRGRVTLVDVAKASGVSPSTVSLVLRNSPTIPQRTRDRVLQAASSLGYVYNRGAASMRSSQSRIVGVVVNDLTNPYFAEIVASIQDAMAAVGRVVVMSNSAESIERQTEFVHTMREYNVDGIVLSPAAGTTPDFIGQIRSWQMPCILFSRSVPGATVDYVGADNRGGARASTRHLIEFGHRRIAMIGVNEETSTGRERFQGYKDALEEAGIHADSRLAVRCPATRANGMTALLDLLDGPNPPTAAACFNDILGFGVMLGLLSRKMAPGRDFSVVGFDDIAESELWRPALTSVSVSRSDIAGGVINLLNRRLEQPDAGPLQVLVKAHLVMRDSTALVPVSAAVPS